MFSPRVDTEVLELFMYACTELNSYIVFQNGTGLSIRLKICLMFTRVRTPRWFNQCGVRPRESASADELWSDLM